MEGLAAPVMVVEGVLNRVTEGLLGGKTLVLEHGLELAHQLAVALLVLADVGEGEVGELEHGLQVLNGRLAANDVGVLVHAQTCASLLAGSSLLQFGEREVTLTAHHGDVGKQTGVGPIILAVQ